MPDSPHLPAAVASRRSWRWGLAFSGALLLLLVASPAAHASRRSLRYGFPEDRVERFHFSTSHHVRTELLRLPPEAAHFDVTSLESRLGEVFTQTDGYLERFVARVFRDGSLGLVTRFVDAKGQIGRAGGPPKDIDLAVLQGKSIATRLKPSGELLDSTGWAHLAGAGRGLDLISDVILQSILRLPFELPKGDATVPATFRLRVPVDPFLMRDMRLDLRFVAGEPDPDCGRKCVVIDYSGVLSEIAEDGHPARPMAMKGQGSMEGSIVLTRRGSRLRAHRWQMQWDREITSLRENGTERGAIRQIETIEGSLRLAEDGS